MFSLLSILIHFFVADFDFKKFVKNSDVSFYCEELENQSRYIKNGRKTVGKCLNLIHRQLSLRSMLAPSFSGDEMFAQKMFQSLKEVNDCSWQKTMCRQLSVSEYTIYGVFVRQVLGISNSGHYI